MLAGEGAAPAPSPKIRPQPDPGVYRCAEAVGAEAADTGRENRAPIDAKKSTNKTTPIAIPTVRDMMV
jgi:hypothetical protein